MKRILLLFVAVMAFVCNINAQSWNMVVTHKDGTVQVFPASEVKNVTFQTTDKNADQVIIKELYTTGVPYDTDAKKFFRVIKDSFCITIVVKRQSSAILQWAY